MNGDGEEAGPFGWRILAGRLDYGISPEATTAWGRLHAFLAFLLGILLREVW